MSYGCTSFDNIIIVAVTCLSMCNINIMKLVDMTEQRIHCYFKSFKTVKVNAEIVITTEVVGIISTIIRL